MANKRYVARLVMEAGSAFAVNSGRKTLESDNEIVLDAFGLPYIPGTSIAGVLRHAYAKAYPEDDIRNLFGASAIDFQDEEDVEKRKEKSMGSAVLFSSAHLIGHDGKTVIDGLDGFAFYKNLHEQHEYYSNLLNFARRDHVRISDRGATDPEGHGKFERTLVCKGARFCFEMELVEIDGAEASWARLKAVIASEYFRLGAGTRKGAGKFDLVEDQCKERVFDLEAGDTDLQDYLAKASQLNSEFGGVPLTIDHDLIPQQQWDDFLTSISPEGFFLFGTSLPGMDSDADNTNTPKVERVLVWSNEGPRFKQQYLFPATSIKGALSHRLAFHYNRITDRPIRFFKRQRNPVAGALRAIQQELEALTGPGTEVADRATLLEQSPTWRKLQARQDIALPTVGEANPAVARLFGTAKDGDSGEMGNVIIEDIYVDQDKLDSKVLNHTKIDRLTGGAYSSALFHEEALKNDELTIQIDIRVAVEALAEDSDAAIKEAWYAALEDLVSGHLPLGAATTKGYGVFEHS